MRRSALPRGCAAANTVWKRPDGGRLCDMKVLHIITGLERGGAETMLTRLAPRLGFRNIVVSLTSEGSLGPELRAAGVPVLALGMKRGRPSLAAMFRLREIVKRERPTLLQTWLYHADLLGLLTSLFSRDVPLVWNLRCSDLDVSQYSVGTRAVRWVLARASSLPAAIVVNSAAGRASHEALGYRPKRWELIPNGFDTDRFQPDAAARARFRREFRVGDNEPLVGMIARVDPMKDYDNFFAAAGQIAAARPEAKFLVAGRGTETLMVPPGLLDRVSLLGERGDVATLLTALDLMILSSAFGEGFPNILGEAMACGVPCVATDVGDSAAIIGDTGRVVPPRDPAALCDAALAVLACRPALAEKARRRIVDHFFIDAIAEQYRSLYANLTS